MMESKFYEIKNVFIGKTKEISSSIKEEIKTLFTEELAKFTEVNNKMDVITLINKMLQQHIKSLNCSNEDELRSAKKMNSMEDDYAWEQKVYLKRKKRDLMNEVQDKVRNLFEEAEVTIPDTVLDRAHHASKNNNIIIRFTTFCHRTLFYRNYKTLEGKTVTKS